MDQQQPAAAPAVSGFMTRATNVFLSPSELYTEVAGAPVQTSSWLLPYILLLLLALVSTYAVYTNTTLRQQVYSMQEKAMQKLVTEGKLTQDQMDTRVQQMENSGPVLFVAFGWGFQLVAVSAMIFLGTLLFWIGAKLILKFPGSYTKVLEVVGLASLIGVLGGVVTIIMMYLLDSLSATPGGGLLLGEAFDPTNKGHKLLAALNLFTFWEMGLVGFGLSKISGKSVGMGLAVAFGFWALWTVCLALLT